MSIHIYLYTPHAQCVVFALLFLLHKTIHQDCSVNGVLPYYTKQWVLPTAETSCQKQTTNRKTSF